MGKPPNRPAGPPTETAKVVSIVRAIERRRLDEARARASATHLRKAELEADWGERMAELADLDLDEGIAWCEQESSREARSSWAVLRSLRAYRRCAAGDTEGGLAEWAEVVAAEPEIASVYLMRARWLAQTDVPAALADCERAVAAEPRNASSYVARGDYCRLLGDNERAAADYRRALSLDPSLHDVHYTLGTVLATQGKLDEARAAYSRAIRLAPRYVEPYLGRAGVLVAIGDNAAAVRDLDAILALDPSRDDIRAQRANCLARSGDHGAQLDADDLGRALALVPGDPNLHCAHARSLALAGRMAEAVEAASAAIALAPDHILALRLRAVYRSHADPSEAGSLAVKADLRRAWELSPKTAVYRRELIEYLLGRGDVDEAIAVLDRAIELEPDSAELYFERGSTKSRRHDVIYSNTDREDDETPEQEVARSTSAYADIEKAIALGKRDEDAYWELMAAREGMGDKEALRAEIDRILAIMPDFTMLLALRENHRRVRGDAAGAAADRARLLELGWRFPSD